MRNPIMVGERVYLRPDEISDAEVFTAGLTHDPETLTRRPFSNVAAFRSAR